MSSEQITAVVLADIALVAVVSRLVGTLFAKIRQPVVIGEILAGIALGPTLLGLALPGAPERLFPSQARPYLNVIAQLALVIFMFLIGLELDTSLIRGQRRVAALVSASSVALPLGLGALLALWLYPQHAGAQAHELSFALFLGAAMAVTAFPVLARILTERGMYRTRTGTLTMACAAVDDVLAWSLLALIVALVHSDNFGRLPLIAVESAAFVTVLMLVARPLLGALARWHVRAGRLEPGMLVAITAGALLSGGVSSAIGIHPIFGAFLFGAVFPRAGAAGLIRDVRERLEAVGVTVLLPIFFIVTGLQVNVSTLDSRDWVQFAAVLGVACGSKFVGAAGTARLCGVPTRRALAVGVLMNTRGLTELVILSVGLQLNVIDQRLFTIMVLMAIVTTVVAAPLLRAIYPARLLERERAECTTGAPSRPETSHVSQWQPSFEHTFERRAS